MDDLLVLANWQERATSLLEPEAALLEPTCSQGVDDDRSAAVRICIGDALIEIEPRRSFDVRALQPPNYQHRVGLLRHDQHLREVVTGRVITGQVADVFG